MVKWISIGVGVVTVILIAFIVAASLYPGFREASRDIAIVLLAVLQMIGAILTIALLFALLYAVNALNRLARDNLLPKVDALTLKVNDLLDSTRTITSNLSEAAATTTSTTAYVAERVVSPVIRVSGLLTGVRATAKALARRGESPQGEA